MAEKPILFNTDMVRAILDGRKTVTRRVVKGPYYIEDEQASRVSGLAIHKGTNITHGMPYEDQIFSPGDILWVRETWTSLVGSYLYRADQKPGMKNPGKWCPSIHMPKEAARIWLRVTDVRVERLQEITIAGLQEDGMLPDGYISQYTAMTAGAECFDQWKLLWDSTIKPADRDRYGWDANPWVWVIRFERCEKPEDA